MGALVVHIKSLTCESFPHWSEKGIIIRFEKVSDLNSFQQHVHEIVYTLLEIYITVLQHVL